MIKECGAECVGIDDDPNEIDKARRLFPGCSYACENAENLTFEAGYFDTIIVRDSLHHLYQDADFEKVKTEILRVSHRGTVLIFFDPNVNFMLRTFRFLSAHKDAECNFGTARRIMSELGFREIHVSFNTLFSLPLSGGYVGINFVPGSKILWNSILTAERFFEKLADTVGLSRWLGWRYLIVGVRE